MAGTPSGRRILSPRPSGSVGGQPQPRGRGQQRSRPTLLRGNPPILDAIRRVASLAAGIQAGFGAPCPCCEVSLIRPSRMRRGFTVIELSSACMVSPITARSDQWFMPP